MRGNWMADAKNGTMSKLSAMGSLPGPIGLAICGYRNQVSAKVEAAAANSHTGCTH